MGPHDRVVYNLPYLIDNSIVSYPPQYHWKGVERISFIGWAYLHLSAKFLNNQ